MYCLNPYSPMGKALYTCGTCDFCRAARRRVWTNRIILESLKHDRNTFLTLTYDEEHYPSDGSLNPLHLRYFWDSLRKKVGYGSFRYFAVGEYGEETFRPHYHAAVFGLGPECSDVFLEAWSKGHIMAADLTYQSAFYIAGYVTKKMNSKEDPRLEGRYPEFQRQSNRPGIAATAAEDIAAGLYGPDGLVFMGHDVPVSIKHGGNSWPLGRYIRRKVREAMGLPAAAPQEAIDEATQAVSDLYENSKANPKADTLTLKRFIVQRARHRDVKLKARQRATKRRSVL
jgi:hypothetical protein